MLSYWTFSSQLGEGGGVQAQKTQTQNWDSMEMLGFLGVLGILRKINPKKTKMDTMVKLSFLGLNTHPIGLDPLCFKYNSFSVQVTFFTVFTKI